MSREQSFKCLQFFQILAPQAQAQDTGAVFEIVDGLAEGGAFHQILHQGWKVETVGAGAVGI